LVLAGLEKQLRYAQPRYTLEDQHTTTRNMEKYAPSKEDIARIKEAAAREAVPRLSLGQVLLEPGLRVGSKSRTPHMNIALVSDDPHWNDTDLEDYGRWSDFRKGLELTPDGRAIVDFYIRRRFDPYADLHGNVVIEIDRGRLARISGTSRQYYPEDFDGK